MLRLRNRVQRYEWGSSVAISQFMGMTPDDGAVAEISAPVGGNMISRMDEAVGVIFGAGKINSGS